MQCQIGQSECQNGSCPERAMCQDLPGIGTINCLCRTGYEGPSCNVTVNPCTSGDPCENGATCMPLLQGRYKCICPPGLTGPTCEINIGNFNLIVSQFSLFIIYLILIGFTVSIFIVDFFIMMIRHYPFKNILLKIRYTMDNHIFRLFLFY